MAGFSLLALLDDITTVLDDVTVLAKLAAQKTVGVVGDDLALTAEQLSGFSSARELPVVWAVTKGSLLNKAFIIPFALALSSLSPGAITPVLMLGGSYLCHEGAEKIFRNLAGRLARRREGCGAPPPASTGGEVEGGMPSPAAAEPLPAAGSGGTPPGDSAAPPAAEGAPPPPAAGTAGGEGGSASCGPGVPAAARRGGQASGPAGPAEHRGGEDAALAAAPPARPPEGPGREGGAAVREGGPSPKVLAAANAVQDENLKRMLLEGLSGAELRDYLAVMERRKIKGAVRTDLVLSAEIIIIALGSIPAGTDLLQRAWVLAIIGLAMTFGVYGFVGALLKFDDLGFYLLRQEGRGRLRDLAGRALVGAAPHFVRALGVIGTAAMFLVGGGIMLHGLPLPGGFGHLAGLTGALASAGAGLVWGSALLVALLPLSRAAERCRRARVRR